VQMSDEDGAMRRAELLVTREAVRNAPLLDKDAARFFSERCYLSQSTLGRLLEIYELQDTRRSDSPLTRFVKDLLGLDRMEAVIDGLHSAGNVRRLRDPVPSYWAAGPHGKIFPNCKRSCGLPRPSATAWPPNRAKSPRVFVNGLSSSTRTSSDWWRGSGGYHSYRRPSGPLPVTRWCRLLLALRRRRHPMCVGGVLSARHRSRWKHSRGPTGFPTLRRVAATLAASIHQGRGRRERVPCTPNRAPYRRQHLEGNEAPSGVLPARSVGKNF
jgi:hypothetical protein